MATILGARLLLMVIVLDCFLYFGMAAVNGPGGFGNQVGVFVNTTGSVNDSSVLGQVNYSGGGTMVQASSMGWTSTAISSILTFVATIFNVMTAPMTMVQLLCGGACTGGMIFVQVLVGGTYIVLVLASIAQLISGRFA